MAAAGLTLAASILPNGELAVVGGNGGSSRGVECPELGWIWLVSWERSSVVRVASLPTLAQKLHWPLDLAASGETGVRLVELATDGKGTFFTCSDVSSIGCFSLPLQALSPVSP